jgi:AhpC/TSA family
MVFSSNKSVQNKLVIGWLVLLAALIGTIFWQTAWKYSLPTPIPSNYRDVPRGTAIVLPASARPAMTANKPLFLHFFNPACPCSRFNMPQFRALVQQYGQQVFFAIVVMSPEKYTAAQLQTKFDLPYPIPVLSDSAIAAACGVYSTPQAVIIGADGRLFYRGNYNRSRYCSDERTGFARQALDSFLHHNYSLTLSPLAFRAYGCQLPTCRQ